jgi:hypothetical protein
MRDVRDVVVAEFDAPEDAARAARRVRALGYEDVEVFGPFPVPELDDALAVPRTRVPALTLLAGVSGAAIALAIQWWTNAYDYPIDVGGRPLASWPTYVVIVFETTVLLAAFATFAAVLLGSRLPRLYDPVFDLPGIERSTIDRFCLAIGGVDLARDAVAHEELDDLRAALTGSGAVAIHGPRERA